MRVDTLDKISLLQKVVGYAFFPLFVDRATGEPARVDSDAAFALNTGNYQIPLFCEVPKIETPLFYEKFMQMEKIP